MLRNLPSRRLRTLFLCLILFIFGSGQAFADVITVNDLGGADYTTIQAAINNATPGDVIVIQVGSGTYSPTSDLDLSLMNGSSPGDLAITTDGSITIDTGGGATQLYDNGAFNANLVIDGIIFDNIAINLTDVNDFYLTNCTINNKAAGPFSYAVEYNRGAGGGAIRNMSIIGNTFGSNAVAALGLINATDDDYNVYLEGNTLTSNTNNIVVSNEGSGNMSATIIKNNVVGAGANLGIHVTHSTSLIGDFYIAENVITTVGIGIGADMTAGTGVLRIINNDDDGGGGAAIDNFTTTGISVALESDAVIDVEVDNNYFGSNASNGAGIFYSVSATSPTFNDARISNNTFDQTNAASIGIQVILDDASAGASADVTIDGNRTLSTGFLDGFNAQTLGTFDVDFDIQNNDIHGSLQGYYLDASVGFMEFTTASGGYTTLNEVLVNGGNITPTDAEIGANYDFVNPQTIENPIVTITPAFANDLNDANITGNSPGFGQVSSEELISAQTVAVPLGSKVGVYDGPSGQGQVEPLFNSPPGTDVAYYMQIDGDGIVSAGALNFTINDPDENALQFNAANGDLVDLPLSGVVPTGISVRTIEFWVKRDNTSLTETFFAYGAESLLNYFSLQIDGSDEIRFSSDGTASHQSNLFISDNDWHHVAVTYDGTTVRVYLDGVVGSGTFTLALNTSNTNVEIGQKFGGGESFDGAIDEFAVWDVARSVGQITTDATMGITLPNGNVLAYYKCNQGEEGNDNTLITELIDENLAHGGSFYNGTLVNFTLADSDFESNFVNSLVPTVFAQDIYVTDARDIEVPDGSAASTVYDTDWETQSTGYMLSKAFAIHNVGLSDLGISAVGNITISGDTEFALNLNAGDFPLTIAPGNSYFIDVEFTPSSAIAFNATVSITSDDPDESPYTFAVTGTGAAQAEIDLTGNSNPIESDNGPSGSTDTYYRLGINSAITKTYTIENNGSAGLSNIDITSDDPDFVLSGNTVPGGISGSGTIANGSSATFDVTYQANNSYFYDEHSAIITITSTGDPNEATYLLNIRAESKDNALHFEGVTDGADDQVDITPTTFNPANANDELTVEAWINLDSYGGTNSYIVGRYDESGSTNNGEFYLAVTAAGNLEAGLVAGSTTQILNSSNTIGLSTWTHVAMTYDGANMKIFINGILEDDTDISGSATGGSTRETYLGYTFNASNNYNGQIDEVRIWDLARTPYEIRQNALARLTGSESNLVAYFNFDDGVTEGLAAENATYPPTDLSGTGLTTSLVNFDYDGGAGGQIESNYVESFALETTGLQDIIVTNNFFDGNDNEITDGSATPTLDVGTFMGRADNGDFITQTYTITNDGLNDLTINSISGLLGDFSYDQSPAPSTVLGPGDSFDVIARFTGANNGTTGDNISINSDDPTVGEDDYDFNIAAYSDDDNALDFDGVDDEVNIANGEDLFNNLSTADSWTLLTWVKIDDISGVNGILAEPAGGGNNSIVINNGTIEVYDNTGTLRGQSAAAIIPEGVWTHIAVVSQTASNTFFYVNGVLDGAPQMNNSATLAIAGSGLTIGDDGNGSTGYFDGALDDLIFWNSGFSQSLVQFVMSNTISGNEGGLFAYYRFDHGTPGIINGGVTTLSNSDDSGATYDGTLSGFDVGAADVDNSNWVNSYVRYPDMVVRGNSAQVDIAHGETGFGLSDDREFGSVALDGPGLSVSTVIFDIASIGGVDLDLLSTSSVSIAPGTDFSVTAQPGQTVNSGTTQTFTIEFDPLSAGTKTETISITNDGDNAPYTFDVQGFGGALPAIDVESAGGSAITDEEVASVADETDYGDVGIHSPVARTFTINNTGGAALTISSILSDNNDFVVSGAPGSVASLGSETFTVTYQANNDFTYSDDKAATITINSDDPTYPDFEVNFLVDVTDNSLDFDGVDDEIINLPNTAGGFQTVTTDVTIEAWVRPNASGSDLTIFEATNRYSLILTTGGALQFEMYNPGATSTTSSITLTTSVWHHVAASYDGDFVTFYIDGYQFESIDVASDGFHVDNASTPVIGNGLTGTFWDGQLDELRVWNTARTGSELRANAITHLVGNEAGLVAYYDFDFGVPGGSDNSAMNVASAFTDITANNIDGTMSSGPGFDLGAGDPNLSNFILSGVAASTAATSPEIAVLGAGDLIEIPGDGSNVPAPGNNDHYGTIDAGSTADLSYQIHNYGLAALTLTGGPFVTDIGGDSEIFIQTQPSGGTVAPGGFETFTMRFNPGGVPATYNNGATINNDDADESVYVFNIDGVSANLGVISDLDASDNFTFNEDQGATIIDGPTAASISDADTPTDINGATLTVSISNNREDAEDELNINDEGTAVGDVDMSATPNITYDNGGGAQVVGSFTGGTGSSDLVITFNAFADLTTATDVIQQITYNNINSAVPVASVRTVTFVYNDGSGDSDPANVDITVNPLNDVPVISNLGASDDFTFTEEDGATIIDDGDATITDGDLPSDINGLTLTVSISANRVDAEDELAINDEGTAVGDVDMSATPNITYDNGGGAQVVGSFTGGTGASDLVITFNANADFAIADDILRNITYNNNNTTTPNTNTRTVSFVYNDGIANSVAADVDITISPQNDLPSISIAAAADNPFLEGGSAVIIEDGATFTDAELGLANDFDGSTITIFRNGGADANDVFTYNDDATYILVGGNGGNIQRSGSPIAQFTDDGAGTLTIDFNGGNTATQTDINTVLQNVTYSNANGTPAASVMLDIVPNDGTGSGSAANTTIDIYNNDSDIAATAFGLPATLDYISHTGADILNGGANGIKIGELEVRDGGGSPDTDGVGTILTDINLKFTNFAFIQEVALYDASFTTELGEVSLVDTGDDGDTDADEAVFTGLTLSAADDGNTSFSVVVSFNNASGITDNTDQIGFTVISATSDAAGSQFNAADAGGASPTLGGNNTIIVNATDIEFTDFAGGNDDLVLDETNEIGIALNVPFSVSVAAVDANGNVDVDYAANVAVIAPTPDATFTGTNINGAPLVSGAHTWSDLLFTTVRTGVTFTVQDDANSYTDTPVFTFDVSDALSDITEDLAFVYPTNIDYTLYSGNIDTQADGVQIAQFIVTDGGFGLGPDTDTNGTRLDANGCGGGNSSTVCPNTADGFEITVISGLDNIDKIALYTIDATLEIGANVEVGEYASTDNAGTGIFTFNLDDDNPNWPNNDDYTVADGGSARLGVWVTFKQGAGDITDNEEIVIEVTDAHYDTNFSALANDNGAPAATPGDAPDTNPLVAGGNQMEVTGDRLIFSTNNPTSTTFERGIDDFNFTVQAQDALGNVDLDETSELVITSTGGAIFEIDGFIDTTFDLVAGEASPTIYGMSEEDATTITVADNDGTVGSEGGATTLSTAATSTVASSVNIHDTTAPFVATPATDVEPDDDAAMDPITNTLTMQFNEEVAGVATKNITLLSLSPSVHVISIDADDPGVVSDANGLVTITLPESPKGSRSYSVTVDDGAFDDSPNNNPAVNGGAFTYVTDYPGTTEWNFTTPVDATPPTVTVTRNPITNGDIDVATSDNSVSFDIAFTEEISNFAESDILVTTSNDLDIGGDQTDQTADLFGVNDIILTPDGDNINWTLTITAINSPTELSTINITIQTGANRMEDEAGNDLATPVVSSNFIFDHTAPVHTVDILRTSSSSPALTGVIDDLTATISLSVDGNNYPVTNPGTGTWTLPAATISPALSAGTFNVIVTATDDAGNSSLDGTSNELTVDLTKPTIIAAYLFDHDNSGDLDEVTIEFSEDVQDATVELTDWTIGGATPDAVVPFGSINAFNTEDLGMADDQYVTFDVSGSTLGTGLVAVVYTKSTATDIADIAGNENDSDAAIAEVDLAEPVLNTAWQYDTDGDGNIDEIVIEMNEEIDENTAVAGNFALGNNFKADGSSVDGILLSNVANNALDANETDQYVTLDVTVVGSAEVTVDYTAGTLTDASGNSALTTSIATDDQAAPVFISATYYDVEPADGDVDEVLVEMSEPITDIVAAAEGDFLITGTTLAIDATAEHGAVGDIVDDQYFTFDITGATGTGTLTLDYDPSRSADADLVDKGANTLAALANPNVNPLDAAIPRVVNVTSNDADDSYRQGDLIQVRIEFTESVVVGGQPLLTLETGTTDRDAQYTSGTGTNTIVLGYTVQSGDESTDLDYVGTGSLTLNGGSIDDASANAALLTLVAPAAAGSLSANKDIIVDNTAPTVDAITRNTVTNGDDVSKTTNDNTVSFNVDFADDIDPATISFNDFTVIVTGDITFDDLEAADLVVFNAPTAEYTISVTNIAGDGTIKMRVSTDVQDLAGNFIASPVTSADAFTIDNTAPQVTFTNPNSDPTNSDPFNLTVDFDQSISGLLHTEFNVAGGVTTGIAGTDPGAGPFTLTINPTDNQTGNVVVSLQANAVQDLAGNNNALSSDFNAGFDDEAPNITSSVVVEGLDLALTTQLNETGMIYWGLYPDGTPPTSDAQLVAGTDPAAFSLGNIDHNLVANDISVDILLDDTGTGGDDPNTDFDLYIIAEDDLSPANQEASSTLINVRSGGVFITAPTLTDICLEGDALVLGDIVILEDAITDFRSSGSPRTLKLELPVGFEFNTSAAGDGVSRLAGGDIAAGPTLAYPASNAVQITYSVPTQNSGTPDQLTITGLEIMAVGATDYSGVTITRTGGSGDIYLASEGDARTFATLTSEPPFNAPQIVLADPADGHPYMIEDATNTGLGNTLGDAVAAYTVNAITGNLGTTSPFTIHALNAANTVYIYSDETLMSVVAGPLTGATSYSPTLTNLGLNTGDLGITNFWVAVTDGISCESEGTKYSVAIVESGNSAGETVFTEDDDTGTTVAVSLPAGYSGLLTGDGLNSFNYNDNSGAVVPGPAASVNFIPSLAGLGNHTLQYTLTAGDGVEAVYEVDFIVNTESIVFDAGMDKTLCNLSGAIPLILEDPDPGNDPNLPDFHDIEIYRKSDLTPVSGAFFVTPVVNDADWANPTSLSGWSFDPEGYLGNGATVGDTLVFRMLVQNNSTGGITTHSIETVILYSIPRITTFDNGDSDGTFDRFYCENDGTFNITGVLESDIGSSSGIITTGYTLTYFGADNAFGGIDDVVYDLTASGNLHNDFDPTDPNRENADPSTQIGTYRISYTTPELPAVATGCQATIETDIAVLAKPATPNLSNDFTGQGGLVALDYVVEYTEGTNVVPDPAAVTGVNSNSERFHWYNDAGLISAIDLDQPILDLDVTNAIPNTNGALTKDIYFTTDHYYDSLSLAETFAGCTSDARLLSVQVHEIPDEVIVDHGASTAAFEYVAGNEYIYEYCVADGVTVATMDPITLTNFLDNDEPTQSYYILYEDDMVTPFDSLTELTASDLTLDPLADLPIAGWAGTGGQSVTFYVSQRNHDNNYPTDLGAEYSGAESTQQKITIEVNIIPDAPDDTQFTGGDAQYFLCSGETLENIVLTNDSDPRFEWFPEDGNTGTPDLTDPDGFDVTGFNGRFAAQADLLGFSNVNGNTDNTPIVYHYYVRQYTDYNDFTSYQGCVSNFTEITITVYPDPPTPIFDIAGDPTNLEINVCEGDLGSISFTVKTTAFVDGTTIYNWYPSNDGTTLASATPRFTGATATGVDLAITTATQGASPLYFLVSQENNSGACETELASMALLTINVYDIPSAPTILDDDIYYCEAGGAGFPSGPDPIALGEAGATFNWYADIDGNLFGETLTHNAASVTETDLGMDGVSPTDTVFYVSQNQTDAVAGNGLDGVTAFTGCTSPQLEVNIHKLIQYAAPVVTDASICDQDAVPTFAATGAESGALISWYDNTPTLRFEDDATFSTLFTPDGSDDDGTNTPLDLQGAIDAFDGTHTMRVTQTTDLEIEPGFAGCTSPESTFDLEIRTLPTIPDIIGSAGNGLNDHDYCSTQDAVTTLDVQTPDATLTYKWYTSSTLASGVEILVADDESINPVLHTSYPGTIAESTNTLIEFFVQTDTLGCLSSTRGGVGVGVRQVTFDFNPLPDINIWNGGTVGSPIGSPSALTDQDFCYSEDSDDDQIFYADVTADGAFVSGVWAINSTGDIYDDDPTDVTMNLSDSYSNGTIGRGEVDNGLDETFDISYTYTDGNGCINTSVETMTVNPLPYMTIINDAGLTFDAVPQNTGTPTRICEADHNLADYMSDTESPIVELEGAFGTNFFGGTGLFSIDTESNTNEALVTSSNVASFSLSVLGDTIELVTYRTFDLIFAGTGPNGCANSVTQPLEIQALPEVTFEKISGGCENPAVEFVPETIWDATGGSDGRDLPYVISTDLDLTWEYYRTNADGSINTAEEYPPSDQATYDPFAAAGTMTHDATWDGITGGLYSVALDGDGDVRDFGVAGIEETFLISDAESESEIFAARLRVHTNDAQQCMNNFQDESNLFANKSVDIEISPSPAFRWEDVSLNEPTKIYMRETRLDADKIEDIFLFWDEYVTFDTVDGELVDSDGNVVIANDTISKTSAYTVPIPTINLAGEANNVFEYTTDPTSTSVNVNPFTEARQYVVTIAFRTSNDCYTTLAKPITIVPSIDVAGDYNGVYHQTFGPDGDGTEPFSLITSGWFPENLRDDVLQQSDSASSIRDYSWTYGDLNDGSGNGLISNGLYPQVEGSDGYAWHTAGYDEDNDSYNYLASEDSWIYSPAFDITGMSRPMVKFTMIYNFSAGNEGAVLQHSTDGGVTWVPLGSYETNTGISTGLDWFDFDNVQADPGQQTAKFGALTALGWAGGEDEGKTVDWISARHSLDAIRTYLEDDLGLTDETEILDRLSNVRFRFAIAATNLEDNDGFFGFALDDFTIQERTKNVLIEQFVSATAESGTSAEALNAATQSLKDDIDDLIPAADVTDRDEVMLAYHADFGFVDPINAINPAGPSARSIYYNVDEVTSILDGQFGGSTSSAKSGDLTWTSNQLSLRSLRDPGFDIVLTPDPSAEETEVKGTVEFIANQDFAPNTEFKAYMVIMEDSVIRSVGDDFEGFGHVMRKMLPSGSGEYVKLSEELANGETLMFTDSDGDPTDVLAIEWNLANIRDDAELSAIVFIQNNKTKEIYQSVKIDNAHTFVANKNGATVTEAGDELLEAKDFNMYPNPADFEVFILFDQRAHEDMQWTVFDQTGRVFDEGTIRAGHEGFSLPTDRFPSGVFYMSIRGEKTKFEFKKLAITH